MARFRKSWVVRTLLGSRSLKRSEGEVDIWKLYVYRWHLRQWEWIGHWNRWILSGKNRKKSQKAWGLKLRVK
jgi:hypothetical protein